MLKEATNRLLARAAQKRVHELAGTYGAATVREWWPDGLFQHAARMIHMPGIYKMLEIVGTSPTSFADATRAAVEEAAKTVHHMDWFDVVKENGRIADGKVVEFQVTLKIGFKLER